MQILLGPVSAYELGSLLIKKDNIHIQQDKGNIQL